MNNRNGMTWSQYNEKTKNKPIRPLLLKSLELFDGYKGNAVEIGSGAGNESIFLHNNGWNVLAVDKNLDGLNNLQKEYPQIQILNDAFENLNKLPECDLVFSAYSIPFCEPQYFNEFIDTLLKSLKTNGRFAGNFFGLNDEWAKLNTDMTFCTAEKTKSFFGKFEIEYFNEDEFIGKIANGEEKYWHTINIIARKIK
ncbi:MAG: methyltransferase domain-containing protein [Defluviitaleaceae bacterium]|nr:methyltransferase domain-containing protein [Defluviitaleaceae bacterium]